jgi:hypothetical protein
MARIPHNLMWTFNQNTTYVMWNNATNQYEFANGFIWIPPKEEDMKLTKADKEFLESQDEKALARAWVYLNHFHWPRNGPPDPESREDQQNGVGRADALYRWIENHTTEEAREDAEDLYGRHLEV